MAAAPSQLDCPGVSLNRLSGLSDEHLGSQAG